MIEVVCAVVVDGDRVLACQRPLGKCEGGKWEFPGGKVENGERFDEALKREMQEELGVEVQVNEAFSPVEGDAIRLRGYFCEMMGNIKMHEHAAIRWVTQEEGDVLDWAAADIPIWKELTSLKKLRS